MRETKNGCPDLLAAPDGDKVPVFCGRSLFVYVGPALPNALSRTIGILRFSPRASWSKMICVEILASSVIGGDSTGYLPIPNRLPRVSPI